MTKKQYFEDHIPHRVNLLTIFRDRYSGRTSARLSATRKTLPWDQPRDFFRCSKDISLLMVRFFCDELGLHLPQGKQYPRERKSPAGRPWKPRYRCIRLTLREAKTDRRQFASLVAVLKAANRAVAHIGEHNVDHCFRERKDHEPLFDVIDWIEKVIQTHMYQPNEGRSLQTAMELRNNEMR